MADEDGRGAWKVGQPLSLVIAGYGMEVEPWLPASVAMLENQALVFGPPVSELSVAAPVVHNALLVPGRAPTGPLELRDVDYSRSPVLGTGQPGTTELRLSVDLRSIEPLFNDVRTASHPEYWTVRTPAYEFRWPPTFRLHMPAEPVTIRSRHFELAPPGPDDHLMYLQGPLLAPEQVPAPSQLVAPGMEQIGEGVVEGTVDAVLWVDLAYQHDQVRWQQRFYYIPGDARSVYLLRVQATEAAFAEMSDAATQVASSFRPR